MLYTWEQAHEYRTTDTKFKSKFLLFLDHLTYEGNFVRSFVPENPKKPICLHIIGQNDIKILLMYNLRMQCVCSRELMTQYYFIHALIWFNVKSVEVNCLLGQSHTCSYMHTLLLLKIVTNESWRHYCSDVFLRWIGYLVG